MKKATLLVIIICILFACNSEKKTSFLNTDNIKTQLYKIDPLKGNTIKGARGGMFTIPAGAFAGTEPVVIELKEIYSPIEILASGLTTESNGELLESGGMFYINAKRDGKQLELLKPIEGSIPSNYINDSMKLFKGEVKEDGNVNWVEPEKLIDTNNLDKFCIDAGKTMFQQNCASCHGIFKKLTGPALAGADQRLTREMYLSIIHDPSAFGKSNEYFRCQILAYDGIMMTATPQLGPEEADCIIKYIKNEVEKRPDLKTEIDTIFKGTEECSVPPSANFPCGIDTFYVDTLPRGNIDFDLPPLHLEAPKEDSADELYKDPAELEKKMRKGFGDYLETTNKDRYNFKINTLGWFNVDAYYKGLEGTSIVDLFVDTDFVQESKLELHVFMPAKKLLTVGNYHKEDSIFHFEKFKGQIPLYLNDKAVAFAVTSIGEKIYYGITAFTVEKKQTVFIKIKEAKEDELRAAFLKMNLDGVDLDVITKKQVIQPKPCYTSDSIKTK